MADDDDIGHHRVERDCGINQRLTLFDARLRGVHIDHIRTKPLARNLKTEQCSRAILKEGVDLRQPFKPPGIFMRLPIKRHPLLSLIEQIADLMRLQTSDAEQVAMGENRRCH